MVWVKTTTYNTGSLAGHKICILFVSRSRRASHLCCIFTRWQGMVTESSVLDSQRRACDTRVAFCYQHADRFIKTELSFYKPGLLLPSFSRSAALFRIRDILVWIRIILGFLPVTYGSGCGSVTVTKPSLTERMQKKSIFSYFFLITYPKAHYHQSLIKCLNIVTICLMIKIKFFGKTFLY